jgi:hypothetical protein
MGIGDWGLGIGDWGLGIGPIPNPQSPVVINILFYFFYTTFLTFLHTCYGVN